MLGEKQKKKQKTMYMKKVNLDIFVIWYRNTATTRTLLLTTTKETNKMTECHQVVK